ncbi:glutaredoxin family protein, partial [Craterilacuibacter sp.]|uniref:glutaredoxin family protein n=1 Tax=Craterilacuibacter sp. TaxID=2870909 RepID=UPI003F3023C6
RVHCPPPTLPAQGVPVFIKALRVGLGQLIIAADFITRPRRLVRSKAEQAAVDAATAKLALYQFHACPFCVKTRRTMHKLNLNIVLQDAKHDASARARLQSEGGKIKVPCLRIEEGGNTRWLYESKAIIAYLEQRFDPALASQTA